MTLMRIRNDHGVTLIDIEGHADYNPGNDVVCAAISTLSYAAINYFQRMYDNGELEEFDVDDTPGDFHIRIRKDSEYYDQYRCGMDFFVDGMSMVAESYPDNLQIEDE